jgi:hypothetical protein
MSREIVGGGGKKLSGVCPLSCVKMTRFSEIVPEPPRGTRNISKHPRPVVTYQHTTRIPLNTGVCEVTNRVTTTL